MKGDNINGYRNKDRRSDWRTENEAKLLANLRNSQINRDQMAPGGAWWREVEYHNAERDGDVERAAELKAEIDARERMLRQMLRDMQA